MFGAPAQREKSLRSFTGRRAEPSIMEPYRLALSSSVLFIHFLLCAKIKKYFIKYCGGGVVGKVTGQCLPPSFHSYCGCKLSFDACDLPSCGLEPLICKLIYGASFPSGSRIYLLGSLKIRLHLHNLQKEAVHSGIIQTG